MSQVIIDNPVINSPFEEPQRHFRFTDDGITDEIVPGRRRSTYFVPIAKSKLKGAHKQGALDLNMGFWDHDVVVTTQTRLTFDVIQPLWRSRGSGRSLRAPAGAKPCSPD